MSCCSVKGLGMLVCAAVVSGRLGAVNATALHDKSARNSQVKQYQHLKQVEPWKDLGI